MEENVKVTIKVDLQLVVSTAGLTDIQVLDAVETIRQSIHKKISNTELLDTFRIDTNAFIENA